MLMIAKPKTCKPVKRVVIMWSSRGYTAVFGDEPGICGRAHHYG